jgi:hypothetical protein
VPLAGSACGPANFSAKAAVHNAGATGTVTRTAGPAAGRRPGHCRWQSDIVPCHSGRVDFSAGLRVRVRVRVGPGGTMRPKQSALGSLSQQTERRPGPT